MNRTFIRNIDRKSITSELEMLLRGQNCSIDGLKVIKIEEDNSLDFDMKTFANIEQLTDIIVENFKTFESVCVMMDDEMYPLIVMYMIFAKKYDKDLFNTLSSMN